MRLVLDTDAVVAAMRSPSGASAAILRLARAGKVQLLATVPFALEYEAVCSRPEHAEAAGLDAAEVQLFMDAVIALTEPVSIWFLWRPQLRDPADELILEAAVNGRADAIVGFNRRDYGSAPARFGVSYWLPSEALENVK
jgi:predicted nucleic acid-binding protein